jgi:hypothetical protein
MSAEENQTQGIVAYGTEGDHGGEGEMSLYNANTHEDDEDPVCQAPAAGASS